MAEKKGDKLVVFATHGVKDPERATIPFVVANAALAMDAKVVMVLQADGVELATKGMYEKISSPGFEPLKKLVDSFIEFGGSIIVCIPCIEQRKITPDMLVQGAQPAKAGRVVQEVLDSTAVVNY